MLAAGGRLLAVVPNRRGLWARMDTTPFGHGRPYSRSQITQLLRETWFTPIGWSEALYVPPIARGWFLRSAVAWERTGATLSAPFAGVHLVEATKQVYRAIPARREKRRLVPALEPALAPSPAARRANDRMADESPLARRIVSGCSSPGLRRVAANVRRRAGRDGGGAGDAAGSDPRSPSWPFCPLRVLAAGCGCCGWPPVMKDGRPVDVAAVAAAARRLLLRRLMLRGCAAAGRAAEAAARRAADRAAARGVPCGWLLRLLAAICWLGWPANGRLSSSPSSKCLVAPSSLPPCRRRLRLYYGFCWRNCSCAAAIRRK